MTSLWQPGQTRPDRGGARRPRERRRGRFPQRRAGLRHRHASRIEDDAADRRGTRRVRGQRRRARAGGARDPACHRRERAEPEPLLAPAVRADGSSVSAGRLPRAARANVRRAEGRLAERARLRGRALAPRRRPPGGTRPTHSPTKFIQELGVAYRASGRDRPVMDALAIHPYRGQLEPAAEHGPSQLDDDRDRATTTSSSRSSRRRSTARRSPAPRFRSSTASSAWSRRSRTARRPLHRATSRR